MTVHLADGQGLPLSGAVVKADVYQTARLIIQAVEGFNLIDRVGEYDGSYANTSTVGVYEFTITGSDPTGQEFKNCSVKKSVSVGTATQPTATTIVPTATSVIPTATAVIPTTPTATPVIPTATSTVPTATVTPTATSVTPTAIPPTPTAMATLVPGSKVLGFVPATVNFGNCGSQNSMVVTAKGMTGLVGAELEIQYDPQIVQVVDSNSTSDGVQIEVGNAFPSGSSFVVQNKVDTSAGIISFAATLLGSQINSDANLFVIHWQPQKSGSSVIKFNKFALADINGNAITATPQNGTVEVGTSCVSSVSGTVVLQGQSDYRGVIVTSSSGNSVETDANGNFTVIGGEPVVVKQNGYLSGRAEVGTASKISGSNVLATRLGRLTLLAGDINSDNVINIFDLTFLATQMYSTNVLADLNKDGKVNIFDLGLAAGNYQRNGPLTNWQ